MTLKENILLFDTLYSVHCSGHFCCAKLPFPSSGGCSRDHLSLALEKVSLRPGSLFSPVSQSTPLESSAPSFSTLLSPPITAPVPPVSPPVPPVSPFLTTPPVPPFPTTPTLDGNRTSEIFGRIDMNSLSIENIDCPLGVGEFGSVFKGLWVSPAGDQVNLIILFYISNYLNNHICWRYLYFIALKYNSGTFRSLNWITSYIENSNFSLEFWENFFILQVEIWCH